MKSKLTILLFIFLYVYSAKAEKCDTIKGQSLKNDSVKQYSEEKKAPVFAIVEQMPQYPGGEEMMYEFLSKNIKYPRDAKETGISGNVIVSFVIEKNGSISDIICLKDIGAGCGEECIRIVKLMPNWIPGKQSGVPVRVQFNLPIRFTLDVTEPPKKENKKSKK